ncbi:MULTISPECIES: GrpB family protein [Alcaligenes]|uniref:GrpB family protein n=1 Tax=Alcaligenes parafaecalis TaxID=171260 RepID=A0ABT3VQP6_9BURK|nr:MULTISPECIES: GrpB family protein [Alcaligenes]MCX5465391.1 GrpB family protein [Alcaligenes parafaecalis]
MTSEYMAVSASALSKITTFEDGDPAENPWVAGQPKAELIEVQAYDANWPVLYQRLSQEILEALGNKALTIAHVGSTAVIGLPAKPVIDIDVLVADPQQEDDYVPALEALGYELSIRERSWYQHRMLRQEDPRVNLHVFGPDCPEHIRHILFRDWLSTHPEDLQRYAQAKMQAKEGADSVRDYNQRKQAVVRDIYRKIFESQGLL